VDAGGDRLLVARIYSGDILEATKVSSSRRSAGRATSDSPTHSTGHEQPRKAGLFGCELGDSTV